MISLQLLPDQLSPWTLLLFILLALALDAFLVVAAASMGVLFVVFKAGKAILQSIDRLLGYVVFTVFRFVEDALESPPLDKIPILQLLLVGVKKAFDIYGAAQGLIIVVVNIVITVLAIVFAIAFVLAFVAINLAALGIVFHYIIP